jgi:replication fork protection complex subunit Csm3/Swi3
MQQNHLLRSNLQFSDVARLLRLYQLWLDDLYPRAKFADGLTIIEKLGHSKRMQMQRKAWINAGRPNESVEDGRDATPVTENDDDDFVERPQAEHGGEILRAASEESEGSVDPFDLDLGRRNEGGGADATTDGAKGTSNQDEPDEDELDALLAAEETFTAELPSGNSRPAQIQPDEPSFDDDEEAMRDMDDLW